MFYLPTYPPFAALPTKAIVKDAKYGELPYTECKGGHHRPGDARPSKLSDIDSTRLLPAAGFCKVCAIQAHFENLGIWENVIEDYGQLNNDMNPFMDFVNVNEHENRSVSNNVENEIQRSNSNTNTNTSSDPTSDSDPSPKEVQYNTSFSTLNDSPESNHSQPVKVESDANAEPESVKHGSVKHEDVKHEDVKPEPVKPECVKHGEEEDTRSECESLASNDCISPLILLPGDGYQPEYENEVDRHLYVSEVLLQANWRLQMWLEDTDAQTARKEDYGREALPIGKHHYEVHPEEFYTWAKYFEDDILQEEEDEYPYEGVNMRMGWDY